MTLRKTTMVLAAGLCLMTAGAAQAAETEIQIEGSTTVGPICDAFVEAFRSLYPKVSFTVKKTGSGDGARALVEGTCQIAAMSRFMKPKEFKTAVDNGIMPVAWPIAMDGVCVVVHPTNPVKALTTEQIQKIFTGEVTNWKEVGGPDLTITGYTRDSSSGTYETFHKLAMKKKKMGPAIQEVKSNTEAKAKVIANPGGIAYVGLGYTTDGKVKKVTVDGVMPTEKTIAAGTYPISRPLFLFTNGYPKLGGVVHAFVTFFLSEQGQEIIAKKGFVPVTSY